MKNFQASIKRLRLFIAGLFLCRPISLHGERPILLCVHFERQVMCGSNIRHIQLAEQNALAGRPLNLVPDPAGEVNMLRPSVEAYKPLRWIMGLIYQLCFFDRTLLSDSLIHLPIKKHGLMLHDVAGLFPNIRRSSFLRSWLQRKLSKIPKNIVTVSETSRRQMKKMGIGGTIHVSYNGVNKGDQKDLNSEASPLTKSDRGYDFILITSGDPNKRDARVLQILADMPSSKVCLVCKDANVKFPGLTRNISVFETISEEKKFELLRNSKVYVNWSRIEGFGIPALEAIISGCRCLLTDIPVFRELFTNFDSVLFLPKKQISVQQFQLALTKQRVELPTTFEVFSWKKILCELSETLKTGFK